MISFEVFFFSSLYKVFNFFLHIELTHQLSFQELLKDIVDILVNFSRFILSGTFFAYGKLVIAEYHGSFLDRRDWMLPSFFIFAAFNKKYISVCKIPDITVISCQGASLL